jgi:hypothetical protein
MKRRSPWCLTVGFLLLLGAAHSSAEVLYTVTDLGTLPGSSVSRGDAINNVGQVPPPLVLPPRPLVLYRLT